MQVRQKAAQREAQYPWEQKMFSAWQNVLSANLATSYLDERFRTRLTRWQYERLATTLVTTTVPDTRYAIGMFNWVRYWDQIHDSELVQVWCFTIFLRYQAELLQSNAIPRSLSWIRNLGSLRFMMSIVPKRTWLPQIPAPQSSFQKCALSLRVPRVRYPDEVS